MPSTKKIWLMLAPALVIIVGLFIGGFILGILQSFNYMPLIGRYDFNLDAYIAILSDKTFLTSLLYTMYIALASTLLAVALAVLLSMGIRKNFKGKSFVLFSYQFPLPIPHLVSGIAVLLMFAQSGFVSRLLNNLGLMSSPADFPEIVYGRLGLGIIISLAWKFTPFVGVAVLAVLQTAGANYEEAAISLGASPWQRFRHVLFPLLLPTISTSSIIIFAYAFSSYEIPFLLGSTYPKTLAITAYQRFTDIDIGVRPQAMAMATIITAIVVLIVVVYKKFSARFRY